MDERVLFFSSFIVLGTLISSVAQVMLKKAALRTYSSVIREYLNPLVIISYVIFFGATLLSVYAYRVVPLSMGPILEASGYVFITIFGVVIFKEQINMQKAVAIVLIMMGMMVYSIN